MVAIFVVLVFSETFKAMVTGNPLGFLPAGLCITILVLIGLRHAWSLPLMKIYAIVFLIAQPVILLFFKSVNMRGGGFTPMAVSAVSLPVLYLGTGFFILYVAHKCTRSDDQ
jgi:hypothetical protein